MITVNGAGSFSVKGESEIKITDAVARFEMGDSLLIFKGIAVPCQSKLELADT